MDVSEMITKINECDALIAAMGQSALKSTIQSAQSILEANNNIVKKLSEATADMPQEERAMLIEELNTNLSRIVTIYKDTSGPDDK